MSRYRHRTKKGSNLSCLVCKSDFYVYESQLGKRGKYCSSKCYHLSRVGVKMSTSFSSNLSKKLKGRTIAWSDKIAKTLTGRKGKANPHSLKTKENMSISRTKHLLSGKSTSQGRGRAGYYFSAKNQKTFYYHSSYELVAMQIFEQLSIISRYEHEVLSIPYVDKTGRLRRTIPDFLVYYEDGAREIIEIKPQFKIDKDLENTVQKLEVMKDYASANDMKFKVMTERDLNI